MPSSMEDIILRALRGDTSDVEQRLLRNWRAASPANERQFQELARLWSVELPLPPGTLPVQPSSARIIEAAEARRAVGASRPGLLGRLRGVRWGGYAAAAAIAVAAITVLETAPWRRGEGGTNAAEFSTAAGQTVTVALTDGSFVRLEPLSRLRLSPGGKKREVWLDGRGLFAVHTDSLHPFVVHTASGDARVRGTRFELRADSESLRLAVVEGKVALSVGEDQVEVTAGEVSRVQKGGKPSVERVENVEQLVDWPEATLLFQATPLREVARQLQGHFGIPFVIVDPKVAQRVVTAWFSDETLKDAVTAVCRATATPCTIEKDSVVIGN